MPVIAAEHAIYWEGFSELSGCRPVGFGPAAVPWQAIDQWARRAGIEGEDFSMLVEIIQAMDAVWIKAVSAKGAQRT